MNTKLSAVVATVAMTMGACAPTQAQNEMHGEIAEVNVIGTRAPLSGDRAVRLVQVLSRKDIEASSAQSVNDLLKLVAGIDVRQRGANGVQTDVGINGGNCDQVTVLLNGVNITNPQTGHLTVDLPVTPDDIERIEVIEGGASRVYGSNAFSGAINIITRQPVSSAIGANIQAGSFGTAGANTNCSLSSTTNQHYISAGYSRSDGGSENSDYKKMNGYWLGKATLKNLKLNAQLGMSRMDYGANTFYGTGSRNQYEEGRRYLAAVGAETTSRIVVKPSAYWNRSIDHYVWTRTNPQAYENFHQTNVYGASLGAHTSWKLGTSAVNMEIRREEILSTRLGKEIGSGNHKVPGHDTYYKYFDGRTNFSLYLEHAVEIQDVSLSLGLIANENSATDNGMELYPGIDLSWKPAEGMRLYASFNKSLRMPTFTDLYYNGPG
ncbi:MAG: TonB-dependent receptor, partial [Bacteroidaceae bacterium]|nr:TonB-dependent receptor [Bacteroidaceae bacterium]